MTRNQPQRTYSPTSSTITHPNLNEESFLNLPDLSNLRESEKQHILNVLGRDESLRSKHLSRFMQLRKEVNELEQRPAPKSPNVCARCRTAFGFLFNTGAPCPKCGEKVCKQCRLLYNDSDSGWLCQLCCKQMQLLSYSGEWIYTIRSNLRKDSLTASEMVRKSLVPAISFENLHDPSSSDTETEDTNIHPVRMIIPTAADEEKLKSLRNNVQKRPFSVSPTRSKYPRGQERTSTNMTRSGSSDDVDSLLEQSTNYTGRTSSSSAVLNQNDTDRHRSSSTARSNLSLSRVQNHTDEINNNHISRRPLDCASVTSSEWGAESERGESLPPAADTPKRRDSKRSSSSRVHIGGSIQSLRDAVHRLSKQRLSASHTSIDSYRKAKSEIVDTKSKAAEEQSLKSQISDKSSTTLVNDQNKSNSRTILSTINDQNSKSKSTTNLSESSKTITPRESIQREPSITGSIQSTNNSYRYSKNNNGQTTGEVFGSVGNLDTIDSDDDDDIDGKFEKAKQGLANRTNSCMDIRGSQTSLNSILSDKRAQYGLDVSGTISLKLTYNIATGALDILIHGCKNLARAKKQQPSDIYIKTYLLPDRSKNGKRRTKTIKNTLDPVFEQKLRYLVTKQDFEIRTLWISVWSETTIGRKDFLGEIHIPLSGCVLDTSQEYQLLAQKKKNDLTPTLEPTMEPGEITFQLSLIEDSRNKTIGTLQVHYIRAKGIYYGKTPIDALCKGVLMPDKVKRKIPAVRQGPSPQWDVPMRWDGVRIDNLSNSSLEISIWAQERFRKTLLRFVRLNLARGHFNYKPAPWSDSTKVEKAVWERFIARPTDTITVTLPLREATNYYK